MELAKAKAEGLDNSARAKAKQYKKSCEAKDPEIARLVAENAARKKAFKAKKELLQKSILDHDKNADDFCRLGEEKSTQIRDLKVSVVGLEEELQV